tara:strand:- start:232 stop:1233 length:1002 start_codon:yes stop_codon:yes gene_type:complete
MATDDPVAIAIALLDDTIKTDDAPFTPATDKVSMIGATFDDTIPDSVDEGDAGALRMSGNRNLYNQIRDAAGNERGVNVTAASELNVLDSNSAAILTAVQIIDDWDESDRAKVNLIVGQAGIAAGAGAVGVTVPRMTLASDDPAVVALQIIDDWDESDRAKVNLIVGQAGIAAGAGAVGVTVPRMTLASDDPAVAHLANLAYDKTSAAVGSQQTTVDNVSNTHLAEVDIADASYHDVVLEVKIIQAVSDESAFDFTLFWGFSSASLTTNSPTQLATAEFSLVCDLVDASGGATTRYYLTPIIQPKGRYLNVWYDCDNVGTAITSVDVTLIRTT